MPSGEENEKQMYEFGPFRVDPEKEILLRGDRTVPLTPKSFQLLLVLVRHSNELVTKDDILKAVWPDTFVEEANLSRNIFLLRKALGEAPEDHRYILTVPGRGYRLAEDVRLVPERKLSLVAATHTKVQVEVRETSNRRWMAAVAVVLMAVTIAGAFWFFFHRAPVLTEKDTVVLADFANSTGDVVFDATLRQGLAVQLSQSPFLSLASDDRIQQTLQLMGQPADARLTSKLAREICQRTAGTVLVEGSIANLGSQFVLGLRAGSCRTGQVLAEEQAQASKKEDVLKALSQVASKLRSQLGESLASVKSHDTPLENATTPSIEALKAYSMGWKVRRSSGDAAARPFFKRAVELDPKFAVAHSALAVMYGSSGESALAVENASKAYQLRERASDNERFFIEAYYQGRVTGNQQKAEETCKVWAQAYPRNVFPHAFLSGFVYRVLGNYEMAQQESEKVIELDPENGLGYANLGDSFVFRDRLAEAEAALHKATERQLEDPFLSILRFHIDFLKGDRAGIERTQAQAQGSPGAEDLLVDLSAFVQATDGHVRQARQTLQQAGDLARQGSLAERAVLFQTRAALWEAFWGNAAEAKREALKALELAKGREVEYGAAFALALSGESSRSKLIADELEHKYPEDTSVRFYYVPSVRGLLALNHGEPSQALSFLEAAAPFELGSPRSTLLFSFGALYPVFVRGKAYLVAREGPEAAREFQKILDHPGIMVGDPIVVLARLELARAYSVQNDTVKARAAYQDFLLRWKGADPDIPILKQAKAEYAKLGITEVSAARSNPH